MSDPARTKRHHPECHHSLTREVIDAAIAGKISAGSALRLIDAIEKSRKRGHLWWRRKRWAERWRKDEASISRDYKLWQKLGFVKCRRNPFKRSAILVIFPWSLVWDDELWSDREKV